MPSRQELVSSNTIDELVLNRPLNQPITRTDALRDNALCFVDWSLRPNNWITSNTKSNLYIYY
jgi:hypothetical protein